MDVKRRMGGKFEELSYYLNLFIEFQIFQKKEEWQEEEKWEVSLNN